MSIEVDSKEELEATARRIGAQLKAAMPPGCGYMLFMFQFGDNGWMTYLSTAEREDMIRTLREFIERQENRS